MVKGIFLLTTLIWPLSACAAPPQWQGAYSYEADFGENAAAQPVLVEYTLELGVESCELSIQGYQVSEIVLCRAVVSGHVLDVKFKSYEDGALKNPYGVKIYTVDQNLFHLHAEKELITHWDAMVPDESVAKPGKYFLKTAQ